MTSISPSSGVAGGAVVSLVVNGSGFTTSSVVQWNGQPRTTTFTTASQITASLQPGDTAVAGTAIVTVVTPSPGGGTSNTSTFTINNPLPVVTAVSPASIVAGNAVSLAISGSGFVPASAVTWNGTSRTTTFINNSELSVSLAATDTATPQLNQLTVSNAPPGGGSSKPFTVATNSAAPPSLALLVPMTATAGASQFQLRVYGHDLSPNSTVQWNGSPRATRFVMPGLVIASVSAADIAEIGTATITAAPAVSGGIKSLGMNASQSATPLAFATEASAPPQIIQRVSVADDGSEKDGTIFDPTVGTSVDGRYVTFATTAQLTPDTDGKHIEIFVRDTCAGVPDACSPRTVHASVGMPGSARAMGGERPSISAQGRYVAFDGVQLDPAETFAQPSVYVRDTCINALDVCTPSTVRISVASDGGLANRQSRYAKLTPEARYVLFESDASNLVAGDTNGVTDVFVRDTCLGAPGGCVPGTRRVSFAHDGAEPNGATYVGLAGSISADGRYVSFGSGATNLVPTAGPVPSVYVRDTSLNTTVRVSVSPGGDPVVSATAAMSGDGRYVAFESSDPNPSPLDIHRIYVRDTCINAGPNCIPSTVPVSVAPDGTPANSHSMAPSIGTDGRFITFLSDASNLVDGDTNNVRDLFIRDTCAGAPVPCTPSTVRVPLGVSAGVGPASAVSAYGRFIAFPGWMPGKTFGTNDVFLARTPF